MHSLNQDDQRSHLIRGSSMSSKATTLAGSGLAIARALQASGSDSALVFHTAGIDLEKLTNDPLCRLEMSDLNRLYRVSVEITGDPYFGLAVATHIRVSNLHALGYALSASSTLMDFCLRLERYIRLVSQVGKMTISQDNGEVAVHFDDLTEISGEAEDAFFGFLILTMRLLYRPDFNPLRVKMHRPMPDKGALPYTNLMCAPVSFSHPYVQLVFDRTDLLQPLEGSSLELAQVNDTIAINYLARLDKSDIVTNVKQKIIEMLPNGQCCRNTVASALCMSRTALQLKLSQRGANFQQLLDDTRKKLGCSYVQQSGRSITEIAFLLGFSNTGNFTRAFKRWTGTSPSNFRAMQ